MTTLFSSRRRLLPWTLTAVLAGLWLTGAGSADAAIFGDNPVDLPIKEFVASPNYNSRPAGVDVDSVIVHTTEGSLAGTLSWLQNSASGVSAHFVIAPDGELYQMVNSGNRAWHATYYNSRSIGVEMVGYAGQASTWNDANLATLAQVLAWSAVQFDIPVQRPAGDAYDYANDRFDAAGIIGHSQIQPWNKSDPGPFFPWQQVLNDTNAVIAAAVPEPGSFALLLSAAAVTLTRRRR